MHVALDMHDAVVSFNECLTDSQAKPGASGVSLATIASQVEALKHVWQLIGLNTWPIVRYRDHPLVVLPFSGDAHIAISIHQSVGDQVMEYDLHTCGIHINGWQVSRDVKINLASCVVQP